MSTWTSRVLIAAAALGLAACDGGFNVTRNAPTEVRLPDGLVVGGAKGWCVDRATTRTAAETAVIVLGSCAAIARNAFAPRPEVPGVVTVSVETGADAGGDSGAGAAPAAALAAFFRTEAGRAALARDGRAASVRILETRQRGNALYLHALDQSAGRVPGAAPDYWRALFDIDGRFVTVSLVGLKGRPIGRDEGLATLEAQVSHLSAANEG